MSENHDNMIDESILSGRLFGAIPALLDNLPAGFAIMQVLLDEDNNPYDFVYKYANNVYAYLVDVSLDDLMKWTWGHLFPDADELLGAFANIALNGGSRVIEDLDHSRKKKTQIICYQPVYGYCAYVMQELDISDAVDVPVEEPSKPEMPAPDAPSAAAQTPQPEVQLEAQTAPDSRAEIPPMAALHEDAQMLPFENGRGRDATGRSEAGGSRSAAGRSEASGSRDATGRNEASGSRGVSARSKTSRGRDRSSSARGAAIRGADGVCGCRCRRGRGSR